jgi:ferredoxin
MSPCRPSEAAGTALDTLEELHMRIVVDYDRCESNAVCMGILPEVFEVRDDDFLYVLDDHPGEELRDQVMECVRACPTQAISVTEE